MRIALLSAVLLVLAPVPPLRAATFTGNRLVNPSFELGQASPTGWYPFGLGTTRWDFGGPDGDRCLAAVGDGLMNNGWYAASWAPVDGNCVYGVSFQARAQGRDDSGWIFAGLNRVRRYSSVSEEWKPQSFHFRTPDLRSNLRFELGQSQLKGTAYFDEVALFPSLPIYRSRGAGSYVLGEGERITDRQYTADFRPDQADLNDRRFLLRFLGQFHQDRWVLGNLDVVYFVHEIELSGQPTLPPSLAVSPQAKQNLKGNVSVNDPEALRFLAQDSARIELNVERCEGALRTHVATSLGGPWRLLGEVRSPGTYKYTLPREMFPARQVYVRLTPVEAARVEIGAYLYSSHLLTDRKEESVYGATHYVDILHATPQLQAQVLDLGELVPKGRDQVKIEFTHQGPRRSLVVSVLVKQGDQVTYTKEESFRAAPDLKTVRSFPYEIKGPGAGTLDFVVRDEKTSEVLLDLRTDFGVPD